MALQRSTLMAGEKRGKDRRIEKTQALLHEALGALIREKPYDEIVLKEILDRANVGRSTFYTHFRDKMSCSPAAYTRCSASFTRPACRHPGRRTKGLSGSAFPCSSISTCTDRPARQEWGRGDGRSSMSIFKRFSPNGS